MCSVYSIYSVRIARDGHTDTRTEWLIGPGLALRVLVSKDPPPQVPISVRTIVVIFTRKVLSACQKEVRENHRECKFRRGRNCPLGTYSTVYIYSRNCSCFLKLGSVFNDNIAWAKFNAHYFCHRTCIFGPKIKKNFTSLSFIQIFVLRSRDRPMDPPPRVFVHLIRSSAHLKYNLHNICHFY